MWTLAHVFYMIKSHFGEQSNKLFENAICTGPHILICPHCIAKIVIHYNAFSITALSEQ